MLSAEGLRFRSAGSASELREHPDWMTCCPGELLERLKESSEAGTRGVIAIDDGRVSFGVSLRGLKKKQGG